MPSSANSLYVSTYCLYFTLSPPPFLRSYIPAENLDSPVIVTPDPAIVERAKSKVRRRVLLVAAVLQLLGKGREATKLRIGLRQWDEGNSVKNDLLLFFSSDAALRLESALGTEERELFTLVWRGDWHKYAECYISQIAAKYLGGEVRGSIVGGNRTAGLSGSISARIGSSSKMKKRGN
ncbi:hypothetical protein CEUSTIGMA_g11212.t1 [Chlamydomonas eustigma]|uniref:Uncharacterized protein n=1 Tax=Chlamydomonas eustigma TaxID=1157962 RepID=A0A250XL37_9CHLO|nr:hypothetical protein CEUSTIGMA_g11212.t1 [Chlamydomonas eustigma]|eukprot:GAX83787.1 hypothetical protein CEUSTIGMA_g11212.t1 [Chlamydomonas eustigma]